MYLRQFKKLRLVNLAGNPIAVLPDYRSYVLSHIKDLTYLDYRRVNAADVASAIEQHQVQRPAALWYIMQLRCHLLRFDYNADRLLPESFKISSQKTAMTIKRHCCMCTAQMQS